MELQKPWQLAHHILELNKLLPAVAAVHQILNKKADLSKTIVISEIMKLFLSTNQDNSHSTDNTVLYLAMPLIIPIRKLPMTVTRFCVTGSPCTSPRSDKDRGPRDSPRGRQFGFNLGMMNEKRTIHNVSIPSTPILSEINGENIKLSKRPERESNPEPNSKQNQKPSIHRLCKGPTPRIIIRKTLPRQIPTLKTCDMKMDNLFQMIWIEAEESSAAQPLSVRPLRPRQTRTRAKQFPLTSRSTLHHRPGTPSTNVVPSTMRAAEFIMMKHALGDRGTYSIHHSSFIIIHVSC